MLLMNFCESLGMSLGFADGCQNRGLATLFWHDSKSRTESAAFIQIIAVSLAELVEL